MRKAGLRMSCNYLAIFRKILRSCWMLSLGYSVTWISNQTKTYSAMPLPLDSASNHPESLWIHFIPSWNHSLKLQNRLKIREVMLIYFLPSDFHNCGTQVASAMPHLRKNHRRYSFHWTVTTPLLRSRPTSAVPQVRSLVHYWKIGLW